MTTSPLPRCCASCARGCSARDGAELDSELSPATCQRGWQPAAPATDPAADGAMSTPGHLNYSRSCKAPKWRRCLYNRIIDRRSRRWGWDRDSANDRRYQRLRHLIFGGICTKYRFHIFHQLTLGNIFIVNWYTSFTQKLSQQQRIDRNLVTTTKSGLVKPLQQKECELAHR